MTEGKAGQRLRLLSGLVLFLFATLTVRLWFLQVLASEQNRERAERQGVRVVSVVAPRGRILDANGVELVRNRRALIITVDKTKLDPDQVDKLLFDLSETLGIPLRTLTARYHDPGFSPFVPVPIAVGVKEGLAFQIAEYPERFPGTKVEAVPVRNYPYGELGVHLLGYTGEVNQGELDSPTYASYQPGDEIGRSGIERQYEQFLRGTDGKNYLQVNAQGRLIRTLDREQPVPGDDVVLSIDARMQDLVEQAMVEGMERVTGLPGEGGYTLHPRYGATVVMDPATGRVVAMASLPGYAPSVFLGRVTQNQIDELQSEERGNPQLNRAIQGLYSPGSTFKPIMALAAMQDHIRIGDKVVRPGGFYPCPAIWEPPARDVRYSNWNGSQGTISLANALIQSCDTIFYPMGNSYYQLWVNSIGGPDELDEANDIPSSEEVEPLQGHLRRFGLGHPTLIDLPYESPGRIPDDDWKWAFADQIGAPRDSHYWYPGDMVNMSIGAGDLVATPLQMAVAYSAIANGGTVYAPQMALRVQSPDGDVVQRFEPREVGTLPMSASEIAYIRDALRGVVRDEDGTAYNVFRDFPLSRIAVGGKTGTADAKVEGRQDTSWFIAMADDGEQQYVVVTVVEEGHFGSLTAAPIVRRILEGLYGLTETDFQVDTGAGDR
jgi:penicillin-binding protein 2